MSTVFRRQEATSGAALAAALAVVLAVGGVSCRGERAATGGKRVIVLGFDGMDHATVTRLMAEGRMPNMARLAASGSFSPLGTSVPPQSPVAWSNFITGLDAGGHGIFDFVHRDPDTMIPYLSTSRTAGAERNLEIGKYQIPIEGGKVELLRKGEPFWDVLERNGVDTTIIRMPANFPPSGSAKRELSGMGTPDILGTYGTFAFYTTAPQRFAGKDIGGGKIYPIDVIDDVAEGELFGPNNPFLIEKQKMAAAFKLYLDPDQPLAKLEVGDEQRVLKVGEWTDWVPVTFDLVPTQTVPVQARFFLKQVRPELEMYVTPLNLDPEAPAMPISTPTSYAAELARGSGRFYTQGMPEDTKALNGGVFTPAEFVAQARMAGQEVIDQYHQVLGDFRTGLLFYYFGNLDQVSHMMWRSMDPQHPAYDAETDAPLKDVIPAIYEQLDGVVGYTLEHMGSDTTLIVMSDHGFTSWRRAFHLNTWLKENGYLALLDPGLRDDPGLFSNVDWSRTRAYGLGINGLYVNLRGRERNGIVDAQERQALVDEIAAKLLTTMDPATGGQAVTKVYKRDEAYKDHGEEEIGPDIVVGYAKGVRGSNESALGKVGRDVITDNTEMWSGDHCMDHEAVPGVLLTSRPLARSATELKNLAAAVLAEFGIEGFPASQGSAAGKAAAH
jgi:predicted AlkP superfamily phosphohydrolase/phosphomutase